MSFVKIQFKEEPEDTTMNTFQHKSSFKKYKLQSSFNSQQQQNNNLEAYINKRKNQNSFTLSEISIMYSTDDEITGIKMEQNLKLNDQEKVKDAQTNTSRHTLSIVQVLKQKYHYKKQQKKKIKSFNIESQIISVLIKPSKLLVIKQDTEIKYKSQQSSLGQSQEYFKPLNTDTQSSQNIVKEEYIHQKSKKSRKKEKIAEKKNQKDSNSKGRHSKLDNKQKQIIEQKQAIKSRKGEYETKKSKQIQNKSLNKEQFMDQIPFNGVLRNCKCCGKLISKLCFKCPHLYCKAQNCPRKRKKILNQRMLERMKQQKIQEHYRQRELYERMKCQKGQNFNPKLISQQLKNQMIIQENQIRKSNRSNKNKKDSTSLSYEQCLSSQDQFCSNQLYVSSQEQQTKATSNLKKLKGDEKTEKQQHLQQRQNPRYQQLKLKPIKQEQNLFKNGKLFKNIFYKANKNTKNSKNDKDYEQQHLTSISFDQQQTQPSLHKQEDMRKKQIKKNTNKRKMDFYFNDDQD